MASASSVTAGRISKTVNIFSPEADDEFYRVLKTGGYLIRVIPLENHLLGLKTAIYDKPYLNARTACAIPFIAAVHFIGDWAFISSVMPISVFM